MYEYYINNKIVKNIINPSYSDDLETYANAFSFSTDFEIEAGSIFEIRSPGENKTVLKGVITDYSQNRRDILSYSGYDFGFYINQNEVIEQFSDMKISDAISKLCRSYQIPCGTIPQTQARIKDIYKDRRLSEVFSELIALAQKKGEYKDVYFTCSSGKFEILSYERKSDLSAIMSEALKTSIDNTINSLNIKVSMNELKNSVVIADNKENLSKKVTVRDDESIKKYGFLQTVEVLDMSTTNNIQKLAQNMLKDLNKLICSIELSVLSDYRLHKGVIIPINLPVYKISGDFLVTSSTHNITKTKESVTVALKMV